MTIQQHRQQQVLPSIITALSNTQQFSSDNEEITLDCVQHVLHLLWIGQVMCRQTSGVAERLCQEVTKITQGKAQLILQRKGIAQKVPSAVSNTLISFSVQFGDVVYGTLCVAPHSGQPTSPALPFPIAQLLAQTCSWLLYTFEQSIFLQGQCRRLNDQTYGPLTRREREVLTLMCLGYDQQAVAKKLCISPATVGKHRQHIYEQLGVHNERDALLAAYQFGLFSILEQISS